MAGGCGHASRGGLGGATSDTIHELVAILHVDVDFEVLPVPPLAPAGLLLLAALGPSRLELLNGA